MKKLTILFIALFSLGLTAQNKIIKGKAAATIFTGAEEIRVKEGSKIPSFVRFNKEIDLAEEQFFSFLKSEVNLESLFDFELLNSNTDGLGITHKRYRLTYNSLDVVYTNLSIHIENGKVISFNGNWQAEIPKNNTVAITKEQALKNALNFVGASEYMWETENLADPTSSQYYPNAELVYLPNHFEGNNKMILCYSLNVYASEPLSRRLIFINAQNGEIEFHESQIHTGGTSNGTAVTAYSDTQNIVTDSNGQVFWLRDSTRGNGVITLDCQRIRGYSSVVEFIDTNNFWNNVNTNLDQYAGDAHWGTEMTYDYLLSVHNRNSIDNNGFALTSYIHYDQNYVNAFWNGQFMTYGDGNQISSPLVTLDVVGHEITHGLTDFTSDLIYANESGALNESFSDIFGTAIEFTARPSRANWLVGEDIGGAFRSMSNPKAFGDPDTYDGQNWIDQNCIPNGANDQCGVHTNSGVQNYWFYLLTNGGTGVNDLSDTFNVTGVGLNIAEKIAFRNLTIYLTPSSDYDEARFYSILSAIDLYGACSPEVEATTNAWYAVGVGSEYKNSVEADFSAVQDTAFCFFPVSLDFVTETSNVQNFTWNFGNGTVSNSRTPTVNYASQGLYTVQLIADGGTCGIDTVRKTNYILIDTNIACSYQLRDTTNATLTDCSGRLYDSGGFGASYNNDEFGTVTIYVASADFIELDFISLLVEAGTGFNCNRDFVEVFDGPSVNSPNLGRFCSNFLPANNKVVSSSNYVTIRMNSDETVTDEGFIINWQCRNSTNVPIADFSVNTDSTCNGLVQFRNLSTEGASNLMWNFGDGATSTEINPLHEYYTNGSFDVSLTAQNSLGTDTVLKTNLIVVNRPAVPTVNGDTFCIGENVGLKVNASAKVDWYRDTLDNLFFSGDSLTLFNLRKDTSFYVKEVGQPATFTGGPLNGIGAGGFSSDNDFIEFDVYKRILLKTMILYSNKAGVRRLDLWNSKGELVKSQDVYVPASPLRVNINMEIDPDTNYRFSFSDRDISLYKNTAGASYPYNISNLVSIKGANNSGEYPYFYRWGVSELPCETNFTLIQAIADTSCTVVSLNDIEATNSELFSVSPNPFNNDLLLKFENVQNTENMRLSLFNANGALVFNKQLPTSARIHKLELTSIPSGVYYLNIVGDKTNFTKKVVKVVE